MMDGSAKPIREVRPGEFVRGRYGEANLVLAKEYPRLGERSMFLINEDHWTTDDHPHFIREGVAAIVPDNYFKVDVGQWFEVELASGRKEIWQNRGLPGAKFRRFEVGVEACHLGEYKRVETIEEDSTWPPDYILYNLVLAGSHTYHVDGYLVTGWPQDVDFNYDKWQPTGISYIIPKR